MLAVSRGLDRDRVVDETGNQTVVFGRRGSRPFHVDEMQAFLRHEDGETFRVQDVVNRVVEVEEEIDGKKQKTKRLGVFTKDGRELVDPNPPPKPPPGAQPGPGKTLQPGVDTLKLPPELKPANEPREEKPPTPAPEKAPALPPVGDPQKTPPPNN
jgi:hypothetical protein